ncbi:MAG: hypothetical protein WB662_17760 [Methyloceanibacter sp.]
MFDTAKAVAEVEERNRLRKEVQLPLLSVEQELQRQKAAHERKRTAEDEKRFEVFMQSALRQAVEDNMLAKLRKRRGDQQWKSTGFLSGGGFAFYVRGRRVMKRLYRRQELDALILSS